MDWTASSAPGRPSSGPVRKQWSRRKELLNEEPAHEETDDWEVGEIKTLKKGWALISSAPRGPEPSLLWGSFTKSLLNRSWAVCPIIEGKGGSQRKIRLKEEREAVRFKFTDSAINKITTSFLHLFLQIRRELWRALTLTLHSGSSSLPPK